MVIQIPLSFSDTTSILYDFKFCRFRTDIRCCFFMAKSLDFSVTYIFWSYGRKITEHSWYYYYVVVDNHKLPHFLGNSELLSHVKDNNYFLHCFWNVFSRVSISYSKGNYLSRYLLDIWAKTRDSSGVFLGNCNRKIVLFFFTKIHPINQVCFIVFSTF